MELKEFQEMYGKPTIEQAVRAFYTLAALKEEASKIEYMHNFQYERWDIVDYIYDTHEILKILKGYGEKGGDT